MNVRIGRSLTAIGPVEAGPEERVGDERDRDPGAREAEEQLDGRQ